MKIITIIGSRNTPENILTEMRRAAEWCTNNGIIVRSGKAGGADDAAILGCMDAFSNKTAKVMPEMYIPWPGFGEAGRSILWDSVQGSNPDAEVIAANIHPAWFRCSQGAKKLHTRNVCQILGKNINTPSTVVLYWCLEKSGNPTGGTATAVNLAIKYNIPVVNMLHAEWEYHADKYLSIN